MERPTSLHTVQNNGEECYPRFCTVFPRRSSPPFAPGAEMHGEGAPSPASSIAGREGDGRFWRAHEGCRMREESVLHHSALFVFSRSANLPVVGCDVGTRGNPLARESIAGRDGDARGQAPNRRSKTTEESLLRGFGHFQLGDPRNPPVVRCESAKGEPAPPKSIAGGHGDGRRSTTQPTVQNGGGQSRSVVLDALDSGIAGFPRAVLRKREVADPPPRVSIAGRDGHGRFTAAESGAKLQGGVFPAVVRQLSRVAIVSSLRAGSRNARGGHPSRHTHLRAKQRWTGVAISTTVQNHPGESPEWLWALSLQGSAHPSVLRRDRARRQIRFPARPSPGATAMDARSHPAGGAKRRRRVSSVVFDPLYVGICESAGVAVRKGKVAPASPGVHRRSGRRWTT